MDIARCTEDHQTYTAPQFLALPAPEIERKRRALVCHVCEGPAFFRRASRSGQAACFGARPHAPGCPVAAPEARTIVAHQEMNEPLLNPGSHIVVDMRYGAPQIVNGTLPEPGAAAEPTGRRFTGSGGGARAAVSHRRPSGLLRLLVDAEEFRHSNQTIEVPGHIQGVVRDVFIPFQDAVHCPVGAYHGYWGFISDAKFGSDRELWLNTGGFSDFSVLIPSHLAGQFLERYGVADLEDLSGVYILAFENLMRSANGKLYVWVQELDALVLYAPD